MYAIVCFEKSIMIMSGKMLQANYKSSFYIYKENTIKTKPRRENEKVK